MKKFIGNQRGFSLLELMISTGLATFLVGGAMYFLGGNEKFQNLLGIKQAQTSDQILGRAVIYKDMRSVSPSFFFLNTKASTYSHQDFKENESLNCEKSDVDEMPFWYTTDVVYCHGVHFFMKNFGDKLDFYITNQHNGANADIFSPEDFYSGGSFSKSAFKNALKSKGWSTESYFKIQASSAIMVDGEMKVYGAIIKGDDLSLVDNDSLYEILTQFCDLNSIDNLDKFLKCLPGTGVPRVKISPVTRLKYKIKKRIIKGNDLKYLERSIIKVGGEKVSVGLLEGLKSVRFYRSNTASHSMSFGITFESRDNYSKHNKNQDSETSTEE